MRMVLICLAAVSALAGCIPPGFAQEAERESADATYMAEQFLPAIGFALQPGWEVYKAEQIDDLDPSIWIFMRRADGATTLADGMPLRVADSTKKPDASISLEYEGAPNGAHWVLTVVY